MNQSVPSLNLTFKPLVSDELPLLHKWLNTPHVSKWWFLDLGIRNPTLEEVQSVWNRRLNNTEAVEYYIVLLDLTPIAFIQWSILSEESKSMALVKKSDNVAGIDVFIGEEDCLYKGIGPVLINKFLEEIVFRNPDIQSCIIDPEPENTSAIRAYEKIGFKHTHTVYNEKIGVYAYMMGVASKIE